MTKYPLVTLALITFALNICGCGSNSGTAAVSPGNGQTSVVQGVAAAGDPVKGTVYLCDSSDPVNVVSTTTTNAGEFSIDLAAAGQKTPSKAPLKPPFFLNVSGAALFSYAGAAGTVNINPLSTLAVAAAAGVKDAAEMTRLYSDYKKNGKKDAIAKITSGMAGAYTSITSSLSYLLDKYGARDVSSVSAPYAVNQLGLDGLFDDISFSLSDGQAVITAKNNSSNGFKADFSALKNFSTAQKNLTSTKIDSKPGNAVLTLKITGDLPQEKTIKNATFSVKLPIGITINTDPSKQSNTAVANTAISIGAAQGSNLYPFPVLSPNSDALKVNISSLSGFGVGNFLEIRYLETSNWNKQKRSASDFAITDVVAYSDIYKSQKLEGITIVPAGISYP
jgi:hypothetical protein